jgi:hypothetical protein
MQLENGGGLGRSDGLAFVTHSRRIDGTDEALMFFGVMRLGSRLAEGVDNGRWQKGSLESSSDFEHLFVLLREIWGGTDMADVGFHRAKYPDMTGLDLITGVMWQKLNQAFIFETEIFHFIRFMACQTVHDKNGSRPVSISFTSILQLRPAEKYYAWGGIPCKDLWFRNNKRIISIPFLIIRIG